METEKLPITIVSGLPRSGTSLMMQMLSAAGLEPLTDFNRPADENNPKGYYELEQVKKLSTDTTWLPSARGKVVKIIAQLLRFLPDSERYRVLFMERDLDEVLRSQRAMIERLGGEQAKVPVEMLKATFAKQREAAWKDLVAASNCEVIRVSYADLISDSQPVLSKVAQFVELPETTLAKMEAVIELSLYRSRKFPRDL